MFGIKTKGKRNYPLIFGMGAAGLLIYLFVATRIVKSAPHPAAGAAAPHPAAMATPTGGPAGTGPGVDNYVAGVVGGTGNFSYPSGLRGIPGGYGVAGSYRAAAYDAFPYSARLAVA